MNLSNLTNQSISNRKRQIVIVELGDHRSNNQKDQIKTMGICNAIKLIRRKSSLLNNSTKVQRSSNESNDCSHLRKPHISYDDPELNINETCYNSYQSFNLTYLNYL